VVFLDIDLPDIDGIEVARQLVGLPRRAAMKVIGVSGYSEGIARAQGNGGLFDAHLLKPVALESLKKVLE
jgi:CheY-like chemotaxis protein